MNKITESPFFKKLKEQAEAHPLESMVVAAMLMTAASKFMAANTARKAANTHALEVARRVAMTRVR